MARSLRMAILGWSLGFLVAGLWGLTQSGSHHLASALLVPAGVGLSVLVVLLVAGAAGEDHGAHTWVDLDEVDGPEHIPLPLPAEPAVTAIAATSSTATESTGSEDRIALLEARLAAEQQQLDEMIHALAEADAAALAGAPQTAPLVEDPQAIELEPVLRRQVIEALAELVGTGEGDLLGELSRLASPGQPS